MFDISDYNNNVCKKNNYETKEEYSCNKNDDKNILTMAFVNMQPLDCIYTVAEALEAGTLFPNLDKPFYGRNKK